MTLDQYLTEVSERLGKATPRPFEAYERSAESVFREYEIRHCGGVLFRSTSYGRMEEDAQLIANAPADLTRLVAIVRVMRDALNLIDAYGTMSPQDDRETILNILHDARMALKQAEEILK